MVAIFPLSHAVYLLHVSTCTIVLLSSQHFQFVHNNYSPRQSRHSNNCTSLNLVNYNHIVLVTDTTIWQRGFNLPCQTWRELNHFHTGQGLWAANLHKRDLASSTKCRFGMVQTMSHIADECPVSKLHDGGLQRLQTADNDVVNCLEWTEIKALKRQTDITLTSFQ